jgi:glycosyltransferase involved in cell wall biosynthesis
LLFVGRIGEEKNIEFLLTVQKLLANERNDTMLLVVGDGPHLPAIKQRVARDAVPRVQFTGRIPHQELPPYYHLADLFLFSSHTETQGLVILEAMAAGLPAVALHDEAFLDIITSGTNGVLVTDATPENYAKDVARLLVDIRVRQRYATAARTTAESFSDTAQAAKMAALYETVIATHTA